MFLPLFLKKKFPHISEADKKKYLLPKQADYEILTLCKELEKKDLTKDERLLVKLIKTQLEKDWRRPLLKKLEQLKKKYI
ncbi:MAG: hypothetical protein HGA85_09250 [Nanoarchaeota archaeon]|nr:hypothetical protein [Nanoarchaeota archaeon]